MPPAPGLSGNMLRQYVRATIGGHRVRLHFSNEYGDGPLTMKAVRLGSANVSFRGSGSVTIPKGETVVSDEFDFDISPAADLVVTIQFGEVPAALTGHPGSRSTSFIGEVRTVHWYVLTGIDVMADPAVSEVIVLGDSITDGRGSTTDGNDRWTNVLAQRLPKISVLNEALGGNTVLGGGNGSPAVERFDRDVLGQNAPGWLIILEGVNDIGISADQNATVTALIAAFTQFAERAHARGMRVYGGTVTPFGGSMYDRPHGEAARQRLNAWIRAGGVFDAVIDFDAAVRDGSHLRKEFDSGDHLHLNPAGYRAMGEAIDLNLFGDHKVR